mmetsp:Transcript_52398/g.131702  ORF Transcript_52398/g.131702 Transcript_52398/m.131702 type:complete len:359 (+) Transcript_52398:260-1336(+)
MEAMYVFFVPWSICHAALRTHKRADSIPMAMSASMKATAWWLAMACPIVLRCSEYAVASSRQRCASPTAPDPTMGRVRSKAPMAILKPMPSLPSRFSAGTATFSNVIPRVSDARWPMLISLRPLVMPGESASTMNAVNALPAPAPASVLASRKYQLATPPLVIHILLPLMIQWSPFFTAVVRMPATSEPAPGSVTQYAAMSGSSVMRPRYFFFCSWLAARMTGASAKEFPSAAVWMPVHAYASSSEMMEPSTQPKPAPPYSSGIWPFIRPSSHSCFRISQGYSPVRSWCAALGRISALAKFRASSCRRIWSAFKLKHMPPSAAVLHSARAGRRTDRPAIERVRAEQAREVNMAGGWLG